MSSHRLLVELVVRCGRWRSAGWWWVLGPFQAVDERVDAGGESLVAVVDPDVLPQGGEGGESSQEGAPFNW